MKVPLNEFDGKVCCKYFIWKIIKNSNWFQVVYGQKLLNSGTGYKDHVAQMSSVVARLADLESQAQTMFLKRLL